MTKRSLFLLLTGFMLTLFTSLSQPAYASTDDGTSYENVSLTTPEMKKLNKDEVQAISNLVRSKYKEKLTKELLPAVKKDKAVKKYYANVKKISALNKANQKLQSKLNKKYNDNIAFYSSQPNVQNYINFRNGVNINDTIILHYLKNNGEIDDDFVNAIVKKLK